jgi:hypothetical protein
MIKKYALLVGLLTVSVLLAACGPKTPSPDVLIRQSVAATLNAIPTPTRGAMPPTQVPTPTPFNLAGLFCEYQFCIGHPKDMAFYDVSAQRNPLAPSAYAQGILVAYNASPGLVIQFIWQTAPGASDPQFMLDLILDKNYDTRSGEMITKLVRNMNVIYTSITTTASPILPFGGIGAWTCGDRVFTWKAYTPDTGSAEALFNDALNRFTCNQ